jgi:hypothetical protein
MFSLCASLVATATCASTLELATAVNKTLKWNTKVLPSDRRVIADAQSAYWRSFSNRLPRLPPSEKAWLEKEMNAGGERLGAVLNRKEFALWSLAMQVDTCLDTYSKLNDTIGSDREWETYFWVKTLNCYRNSEDVSTYLARAGLSNGRYDGSFNIQMLSLRENYIINTIAENVLLGE